MRYLCKLSMFVRDEAIYRIVDSDVSIHPMLVVVFFLPSFRSRNPLVFFGDLRVRRQLWETFAWKNSVAPFDINEIIDVFWGRTLDVFLPPATLGKQCSNSKRKKEKENKDSMREGVSTRLGDRQENGIWWKVTGLSLVSPSRFSIIRIPKFVRPTRRPL